MTDKNIVLCEIDNRGIANIYLNRPHKNNAYNGEMIEKLLEVFEGLSSDKTLKAVVIRGNGKHFQAGADLEWLKEIGKLTKDENFIVSKKTALAIKGLTEFPRPVISIVHGGCFGGGTGIVAASDIVIAETKSIFSISETRWGVMAGIIIPQLNKSIGVRNVRRYAISSERFNADEAKRIGLVHEVLDQQFIDEKLESILDHILLCGPEAIYQTKMRALEDANLILNDKEFNELVEEHSLKRMSDEAFEGLNSFSEKRSPSWYPEIKAVSYTHLTLPTTVFV